MVALEAARFFQQAGTAQVLGGQLGKELLWEGHMIRGPSHSTGVMLKALGWPRGTRMLEWNEGVGSLTS